MRVDMKQSFLNTVERINKAAEWVCIIILVLLVSITVLQVCMRYLFMSPFSWAEEVSLLILVWFGLLSVASAVFHQSHMKISFVWNMLPEKGQYLVNVCVELLVLFFALNITFNADTLVTLVSGQVLSASGISKVWLYYPLYVGGGLMSLNCLTNILYDRYAGNENDEIGMEI